MSEENIALRLKFLIENLGVTSSQFADKCDIARPTLSQLLSGRNKKISNLIIEQIHKAYPGLSVVWLLFGEGDMWSTHSDVTNHSAADCNGSAQGCNDATNGSNPESRRETDHSATTQETDKSGNSFPGGERSRPTQNSLKNPCENPETRIVGGVAFENCKETGVNCVGNTSVNSNNEIVNPNFCSAEILTQIGKIKEKTRKVVQITVYYDDSTFQTFYPNK